MAEKFPEIKDIIPHDSEDQWIQWKIYKKKYTPYHTCEISKYQRDNLRSSQLILIHQLTEFSTAIKNPR